MLNLNSHLWYQKLNCARYSSIPGGHLHHEACESDRKGGKHQEENLQLDQNSFKILYSSWWERYLWHIWKPAPLSSDTTVWSSPDERGRTWYRSVKDKEIKWMLHRLNQIITQTTAKQGLDRKCFLDYYKLPKKKGKQTKVFQIV